LAEQATGKNRTTLLIIADAWTNCALEAERNLKSREKTVDRPNAADGSQPNSSPEPD
jgi:hypothetical protein